MVQFGPSGHPRTNQFCQGIVTEEHVTSQVQTWCEWEKEQCPWRGEQYWVDSVTAVLHRGVYLRGTLRFPVTNGRHSQFIVCTHWVTPASDLPAEEVSQETLSKSHYLKKKYVLKAFLHPQLIPLMVTLIWLSNSPKSEKANKYNFQICAN